MITTATFVQEYFGPDDSYRLTRDKDGFTVEGIVWRVHHDCSRYPSPTRIAWFVNADHAEYWLNGSPIENVDYSDALETLALVKRTWLGEGPEFGYEDEAWEEL